MSVFPSQLWMGDFSSNICQSCNSKKTLQIIIYLNVDFSLNVKISKIFFNCRIFLGLEPSLGGTSRAPPYGCTLLESSGAYPRCQRGNYRLDRLPVCCMVMETHNHLSSHLHILLAFKVIRMSLGCGRKQSDNAPCLRENMQTKHKDPKIGNFFTALSQVKYISIKTIKEVYVILMMFSHLIKINYRTEEEIKHLHDTKKQPCCFKLDQPLPKCCLSNDLLGMRCQF